MTAPAARHGTPCFYTHADRAHTAAALRARSLARRAGPYWDAYAHCDRAPLGWDQPPLASPSATRSSRFTPAQRGLLGAVFIASGLAALLLALGFYWANRRLAAERGGHIDG